MPTPYLLSLLTELAPEFGASLGFEPEYGYAGYISFPNGNRSFFRGTSFDINPQGASTIAKDKAYTSYFLRGFGYSVSNEILVFSPKYRQEINVRNPTISLCGPSAGVAFANRVGFPVYVKPNEGSEGRGVTKAYCEDMLLDQLYELFREVPKVLIQETCIGRDYRIVVLDGEVISAYERIPFHVKGDGRTSVDKLIRRQITDLRRDGRGAKITESDSRIAITLHYGGYSNASVLPAGTTLHLLPNANLSTGGTAVDYTNSIHQSAKNLCCSITKSLGLRLVGVDIMTAWIDEELGDYKVIEVNSAPGLNNYAESGLQNHQRVRELYQKLLRALSEDTGEREGKPAGDLSWAAAGPGPAAPRSGGASGRRDRSPRSAP